MYGFVCFYLLIFLGTKLTSQQQSLTQVLWHVSPPLINICGGKGGRGPHLFLMSLPGLFFSGFGFASFSFHCLLDLHTKLLIKTKQRCVLQVSSIPIVPSVPLLAFQFVICQFADLARFLPATRASSGTAQQGCGSFCAIWGSQNSQNQGGRGKPSSLRSVTTPV